MQTVANELYFRKKVAPWPSYGPEEMAAAEAVLRSGKVNYWTGTEGRYFEQEFAAASRTEHAIALANGTLALEAAWHALKLQPGDEVIVTPRSFMASAASVVFCGGIPVFADVDPDSGNINAETVERCLSPRTRAILAVHLGGWPCPMDQLNAFAGAHKLAVIEDCAQAHGAAVDGRPVGGLSDLAAWSFCQDKIMTTAGEGGMVTLNRSDWWDELWSLKDHGKSFNAVYHQEHAPGFRWLHERIGTNWRLTELQSAMGRVQLRNLPETVTLRNERAQVYHQAFRGLDTVRAPRPSAGVTHAYYRFYAYVRPEALKDGWNRDRIMSTINERGVPCFSGSCSEMYREKAFTDRGIGPAAPLPVARELGETSLSFLVHPTLSKEDVSEMAGVARQVLMEAKR